MPRAAHQSLPPLVNGDRLRQEEFHRRYEAMPKDFRAELIGGIVFVSSPVRWEPHGGYTLDLATILGTYRMATPGVDAADNATAILGDDKEPQPDLAMRILREFGGQTRVNTKGYLIGAPELAIEVAHSTVAIDMHLKKADYRQAGVREYLVICALEQELHWFNFDSRRQLKPDSHGIYRSQVFPGLWIDGPALLTRNGKRLLEVVQQGLASPEHVAFLERLEAQRRSRAKG
jgi:hypothetical protein